MSRYRDVVAFVVLALAWGLTFPAVELGLSTFAPLFFMAVRHDLAGLILLGYIAVSADTWRPRTRNDVVAIVGGGVFWIAIGNGVWFVGQQLTSSALSGLMTGLIPLTTVAFSWVLLPEERLDLVSVVGLLVGLCGALIIVWPSGPIAISADVIGKAILFVGVIGIALGSVLIRWARSSLSSTVQTAWSALFGAFLLHVLSYLAGEPWTTTITWTGALSLAYVTVVSTILAYGLYISLLARHPAIELNLVMYLLPVIAASAGWLLFGEQVTSSMVGGFLVILLGFVLLKRQPLRNELTQCTAER